MPRRSRHGVTLLAVLAATLAPPAAAAGQGPLGARHLLVEVSLRTTRLEYAEYGLTGRFLDGDRGTVPQAAGAVTLRAGPASVRLGAALGSAELRYDGRTQSASVSLDGIPYRSRSGARLAGVDGQLGIALPWAPGVEVLAGAGRRRWDRDIRDATVTGRNGAPATVAGLAEAYTWYELHAGLRLPVLALPPIGWDVEARITRTVDPRFAVDWNGRDVRLALEPEVGWALSSTLRVALGPALHARAAVTVERWAFGASGRDPVTRVMEPASETRAAALELGLGVRY